jgi:mannosyltransferase
VKLRLLCAAAILGGIALLLAGLFLPSGWYDGLPEPWDELAEPPIRGLTIVRLCFAVEGAILLSIGLWTGLRSRSPSPARPMPQPEASGVSPGGAGRAGGAYERVGLRRVLRAEPSRRSRAAAARTDGSDAPLVRQTSEVLSVSSGSADGAPGVLPYALLGAIAALGAALRLYDLGSELWFDEISTVLNFRDVPAFHIIASFPSTNNHLTNTLLVKAAVAWSGLDEWAIRLPAAAFAIATIPAQYLLARWVLPRRYALLAALLLAVSYHHIFFSQNARGYSGYLLWSMLGTHYFLQGMTRNHARDWILYVLTMLLSVAAVLIGFFVIAAHVLAFGVGAWTLRQRGRPIVGLVRNATAAGLVLGLLSVHLYASVVPQIWVTLQGVYRSEAVGYSPFSRELLDELVRGVSQGFGPGAAAGAAIVLTVFGAAAALTVWRRPLYATALLGPLGVTFLFLIATGARFSPRFFIWAVPIGFILVVDWAASLSGSVRAARSRALAGRAARLRLREMAPWPVAAGLILLSVWSLGAYYTTPKQPSRTAVEWVHQHAAEDDVVVAAYLAKAAFLFYGPAYGLRAGDGFFIVHEREELRRIEFPRAARKIWVVTTFPRALRLEYPELYQHLLERYRPIRSFPATIGDGAFTIWSSSP